MKRLFVKELAMLLVLALVIPMFSIAEDFQGEITDDVSDMGASPLLTDVVVDEMEEDLTEDDLLLETDVPVDELEVDLTEDALLLDGLSDELSLDDLEDMESDAESEIEENVTKKYGVPTQLTMGVKESYALKCTKKNLTYKSSSAKVAKVDEKGVITAVKKGKATITVYSNNKKLTICKVTVVAAPKQVTLGMKSVSLGVKEKLTLKPQTDKNSHASFTYTVKDSKIAAVSKAGVVAGKKVGTTTITVKTHNGKKAALKVIVMKAPAKVAVKPKALDLKVGETYALTATLPNKTASNKLTWATSNKQVATVDESGTVTAVEEGTAKITVATFNKKKAVCTVKVEASVESQSIYAAPLKHISEEGVEDAETLSTIREINTGIDEINESIAAYNENASTLEEDTATLCDTLSDIQLTEEADRERMINGNAGISIDNDIFESLSNGATVQILDDEGDNVDTVRLSIGGIECSAYFSGEELFISKQNQVNSTSLEKYKLHRQTGIANALTDTDLSYNELKMNELILKSEDLDKILQRIDKAIGDGQEVIQNAIAKSKKQIAVYDDIIKDVNKPQKTKDIVNVQKKNVQLVLNDLEDKLSCLAAIRATVQSLQFSALISHFTELVSRWKESIEIYKHYHLKDSTVLDNYLLNKAALDLDMYINRLWWNYRIDAVLCVTSALASATSISMEIGKIFKLDTPTLKKLPQSLARGGWFVALAALFNYTHEQLYERNYQFMKHEDNKLHSYLKIKVTDESTGLPLENVKITWNDWIGNEEVRYTDKDGFFDFHVVPGSWYLLFEKEGYKPIPLKGVKEDELKEWSTIPIEVSMRPGFFFGHYEQDNDLTNGPELIEWLVLEDKGDTKTLISRYALDCKPYNDGGGNVTWATCTLRSWLNSTFLNTAFTSEEQAKIQTTTVVNESNPNWGTAGGNTTYDKVYLLSIREANLYFSSMEVKICYPTWYAVAQGTFYDYYGNCCWWLRSPGYDSQYAAYADSDGSIYDDRSYVNVDNYAVRPVVVLKHS